MTGQKIWTSLAQSARFGILIARTDPGATKHKGISYFVCPMDQAGITVRPIIEMSGGHTFNEVFLDEVRLPVGNLVGTRARAGASPRSPWPTSGCRCRGGACGAWGPPAPS